VQTGRLVSLSSFGLQVKRSLSQFTPAQWDKDQWHPFMGPLRFIQVLFLCVVFMTVELNTFFLKFCLWIPPRNPLVVYRLILWWLIAIPTIREYNSYLQDRLVQECHSFVSNSMHEQNLNFIFWFTDIWCWFWSSLITANRWRRLEPFVGSLWLYA